MSLFNSTNFERQGNTGNDKQLKGIEEIQSEVITLCSTALRTIKIFSSDLERSLYDNEELQDILLEFVRENRYAEIKILSADTTSATRYGHQLIRLSQQLTSSMQIRLTEEEYKNIGITFLLIDQSTFIFKRDNIKNKALKSACKNRSLKLLEFFDYAWDQAKLDPDSKRLSI